MKKVIVIPVLLLLCVTLSFAQKKNKKGNAAPVTKPVETAPAVTSVPKDTVAAGQIGLSPLAEHFYKKYSIATRWSDAEQAKDALYDLIAEYPNSDSLILVLAYSYFENEKYPSAVLICQDLTARSPKDEQAVQLLAAGYESLHIYDRALQSYESHYLLTSNILTLYRMAYLQHQLKRYPEAMTNVDILLSKPETATTMVDFNDKDGKPKPYPLKTVVLNLKGEVYRDQGDKINAKKFFEEALKGSADFDLAKKNLIALK